MFSFTAIDFETAVGNRNSICQVGLVRIESGKLVEKVNLLVKPPNNEYHFRNFQIHGIDSYKTLNSPTFDKIWHEIKPFIENQNVVAHNMPFDYSCLKQTLEHYSLQVPELEKHCTLKIYGKKLNILCAEYNLELNHHDALSDALACARLFYIHLKNSERFQIPT